jgi:hypothetical protein
MPSRRISAIPPQNIRNTSPQLFCNTPVLWLADAENEVVASALYERENLLKKYTTCANTYLLNISR